MKKKIFAVISVASLLILPVIVSGQVVPPPDVIPPGPTSAQEIIDLIENIANWLFAILLAVALIFIILSAYRFLTSGGDPANVTKARESLLYAVIGVAVALLARGIVAIVKIALGM